MSLILNIETALATASVSLAENGQILDSRQHDSQKSHAEFLQAAVQELMNKLGKSFSELDAIAVTSGPGSYTGLRVGMASAKGFSFALQKPLITLNTLETMALATRESLLEVPAGDYLICPMIDARRMEVFTALYDASLATVQEPHARVLDVQSFDKEFSQHIVIFSGNGAEKWRTICPSPQARFSPGLDLKASLSSLSYSRFCEKKFADLVLTDPFYVKEFYDPAQ